MTDKNKFKVVDPWLIQDMAQAILELLKGEKITIPETRIDEEKLRNFLGDLMVKENMSFQIVGCGHPQDILNYVAHAISQQSGGLMK